MPLVTLTFAGSADDSRAGVPPAIDATAIRGEIYLEIDQARSLRAFVKAGGRPLLEIIHVGYIAGD